MAKKKRTEMRSKAGKLLYAVRDEKGEFTDIQTYQRAHSADMRHKSKAETEAAEKKKPAKKKKAKAATKKKKTVKTKTAKKKKGKKKAKKKM
jgi:hypothetical protein